MSRIICEYDDATDGCYVTCYKEARGDTTIDCDTCEVKLDSQKTSNKNSQHVKSEGKEA